MFPFGDFAVEESRIFTKKVAELSRIRDMVDPRKSMKTMVSDFSYLCIVNQFLYYIISFQ